MIKRIIITTLALAVAFPALAQTNYETDRESRVCLQVITHGRNMATGEKREFPTSCLPEGWAMIPPEEMPVKREILPVDAPVRALPLKREPAISPGTNLRVDRENEEEIKMEMERERDEMQSDRADIENERREKEEALRQEMRDRTMQVRVEFVSSTEARREKIAEIREETILKRAEIREQVRVSREDWQDQRKVEIVDRIDDALNNINERITNHLLSALEKMEAVLVRVEEAAAKAADEGKDVSAVLTAVSSARTAIVVATEAVKIQVSMDYTVAVTEESAAKEAVAAMREKLRADLAAVRATVLRVQPLVREALGVLTTVLTPPVGSTEVEVEVETES